MQNISGGSFEPLTPPSPPPPLRATGAAPDVPGLGVMQGGMSSAHPLLPHIPPPPQGGGVGLRTPRSLHAWGHGAIAALAFIGTDSSWGGMGLLSHCLRCVSCIPVFKGGHFLVPVGRAGSLLCPALLSEDPLSVPCWWPRGDIPVTCWGWAGGCGALGISGSVPFSTTTPQRSVPAPRLCFVPGAAAMGTLGTRLRRAGPARGAPVLSPSPASHHRGLVAIWATSGHSGGLGLMPSNRACLALSFPPLRMPSSDVSHVGDEETPGCCGAMGWHK